MNRQPCKADMGFLSRFIPPMEMDAIEDSLPLDSHLAERMRKIERIFRSMPPVDDEWETRLGTAAPVRLHYFFGASDWWLCRLDPDGIRGWGFFRINGQSDLGIIYLPEVLELRLGPFSPELDLYWDTNTTLAEVMKSAGNPK